MVEKPIIKIIKLLYKKSNYKKITLILLSLLTFFYFYDLVFAKKNNINFKKEILVSKSQNFVTYQNNIQIGTEKYSCVILKDKTWWVTSEIKLNFKCPIEISQDYILNPDYSIKNYIVNIKETILSTKNIQKIELTKNKSEIKIKVIKDNTVKKNIVLKSNENVYVLDNNTVNPFQHIINAYSHKKGGVQKFKVIVPQEFVLLDIMIENQGFVKAKLLKEDIELIKYKILISKYDFQIFVYTDISGNLISVNIKDFETKILGLKILN